MALPNIIKNILATSVFTLSSSMAFAGGTWQELGVMQGFPAAEGKQVTSANWVWYPYNRWSFQNVDKLLPTTDLVNGQPTALLRGETQDLLPLTIKNAKGETLTIGELLDSHNTDAFMVLHNGKVVTEQYWNHMEQESTHWIASMTKSFTGLAAEILIDQGVIERSKKAQHYVPQLEGTALGSATIDQLLNMTAGTEWDESMAALQDKTSFARQYGNAAGTWPTGEASSGVFGILPNIQLKQAHDKHFTYNSPQADTIGWVMSAATGKRVETLISELFFDRMGSEDRAYIMADTNTYAWATGGLNISLRDAAKFGQMMVDKGKVNGTKLFSEDVYHNITTGDASKFKGTPYDSRIPGGAYSSYFWLTNDDDGSFLAKGMFSQYIYMNPKKNIVIVRFASPQISSMPEYDLDMLTAFRAIAQSLTD
ncbi:hypothetical protein NL53_17240 [Vibrio variabilis]|uniref:Beta-lactamase-related domain-containing protein n=1 Tax=Vibrio variabilis TaxID=990271 RepID=A0ABR4Y7N3_9VIBR|nr:serine hydrolase [Vibrio variabilis]KHA59479.1 hypothetical protein NL53_17240 [Vibrio variabilis]